VTAPRAAGPQPSIWLDRLDEVGTALLLRAHLDDDMPFYRAGEVAGTVDDPLSLLPPDGALRLDQKEDGARTVVAAWPGLLAKVEVRHRVTGFGVVGSDVAAVERLAAHLEQLARARTRLPDGSVRMRFWSFSAGEGELSSRLVEAPAWPDIAGNYARRTADGLASVMSATDVTGRAGRLLLWHGAPGTGKTTAVRALSRSWSPWCRTHYVMDPERLFAEPRYLLEVAGIDVDDEADGRWRLIVAEDCDEYLRSDAKARSGASLGRLLNLCDGILGHGLKVLVLLTTNEDVGRLHPAITRPGRCLSQVEFEPLGPAEAARWLGTGAAEAPLTLAQLYALREHRPGGTATDPLGGYL
jgi:hypothetical protein